MLCFIDLSAILIFFFISVIFRFQILKTEVGTYLPTYISKYLALMFMQIKVITACLLLKSEELVKAIKYGLRL